MPAVRVGVGLSLAVVAFTEKFANLPLGLSFLEEYPLNFTGTLGVPLTDEAFVLCAGAVELLVGLWLALGIFVREVVVVAWFPTNLTLTLFAWEELIGHLPIYGVMAVLLVWGAGPKNLSLWTEGLRERLLPLTAPVGDGERPRWMSCIGRSQNWAVTVAAVVAATRTTRDGIRRTVDDML